MAFKLFVDSVNDVIPRATHGTLSSSLQYLAGVVITEKDVNSLSWRLAGNRHYLAKGIAVPPWTQQLFIEYAPAQVLSVKKKIRSFTDEAGQKAIYKGCELDILLLGGLAAGIRINKFISDRRLYHSSFKMAFGFSKNNKTAGKHTYDKRIDCLPFNDATEYARLRFYAKIDPALCKDKPDFEEVRGTGSVYKHNRYIIEQRKRKDFKCPMNYAIHIMPCYKCHLGYNTCEIACHPYDYELGICRKCQEEKYKDPSRSDEVCVDCLGKTLAIGEKY
jgi:hypothetical protein